MPVQAELVLRRNTGMSRVLLAYASMHSRTYLLSLLGTCLKGQCGYWSILTFMFLQRLHCSCWHSMLRYQNDKAFELLQHFVYLGMHALIFIYIFVFVYYPPSSHSFMNPLHVCIGNTCPCWRICCMIFYPCRMAQNLTTKSFLGLVRFVGLKLSLLLLLLLLLLLNYEWWW